MKKPFLPSRFLLLLGLANTCVLMQCSPDSAHQLETSAKSAQKPEASQQTPEVVVQRFIAWYRQEYERLGSIPIVPAAMDEDTADVYRVDFEQADHYVAALRSNGFFSETCLTNERAYMQAADSAMRAAPQTDGPPEGFNYDRVVFSQDPEADLEKLIRTKPIVTVKGDTARVLFPQLPRPEDLREGAELEFLLTKQRGKWLIENIRPVFAD